MIINIDAAVMGLVGKDLGPLPIPKGLFFVLKLLNRLHNGGEVN